MSDETVANQTTQGNSPESRDSTGTILDRSPGPTTTPSQTEPKTTTTPSNEGGSTFLTSGKTEPKVEDTTTTEPKADDKTQDAPQGAPEKYTDFTLPEGYTFDPKARTAFETWAKANNLTQDAAQGAIKIWSDHALETARAPYDLWATTQQQWHDEIQSRFGGEAGATKMSADINKVINTVLPPTLQKTFRAALDFTGAGSNPDLLEGLSIMLKPLMEGKPVLAGGTVKEGQTQPNTQPTGPIDIAASMYPHLVKNRQT